MEGKADQIGGYWVVQVRDDGSWGYVLGCSEMKRKGVYNLGGEIDHLVTIGYRV